MHILKLLVVVGLTLKVTAICRLKVREEETRLSQVIDDIKSKWGARGFLFFNAISRNNLKTSEGQMLYGNIVKRMSLGCCSLLIDLWKVKPLKYKVKKYTKFCNCSCNDVFHRYQPVNPKFSATESYPMVYFTATGKWTKQTIQAQVRNIFTFYRYFALLTIIQQNCWLSTLLIIRGPMGTRKQLHCFLRRDNTANEVQSYQRREWSRPTERYLPVQECQCDNCPHASAWHSIARKNSHQRRCIREGVENFGEELFHRGENTRVVCTGAQIQRRLLAILRGWIGESSHKTYVQAKNYCFQWISKAVRELADDDLESLTLKSVELGGLWSYIVIILVLPVIVLTIERFNCV